MFFEVRSSNNQSERGGVFQLLKKGNDDSIELANINSLAPLSTNSIDFIYKQKTCRGFSEPKKFSQVKCRLAEESAYYRVEFDHIDWKMKSLA